MQVKRFSVISVILNFVRPIIFSIPLFTFLPGLVLLPVCTVMTLILKNVCTDSKLSPNFSGQVALGANLLTNLCPICCRLSAGWENKKVGQIYGRRGQGDSSRRTVLRSSWRVSFCRLTHTQHSLACVCVPGSGGEGEGW